METLIEGMNLALDSQEQDSSGIEAGSQSNVRRISARSYISEDVFAEVVSDIGAVNTTITKDLRSHVLIARSSKTTQAPLDMSAMDIAVKNSIDKMLSNFLAKNNQSQNKVLKADLTKKLSTYFADILVTYRESSNSTDLQSGFQAIIAGLDTVFYIYSDEFDRVTRDTTLAGLRGTFAFSAKNLAPNAIPWGERTYSDFTSGTPRTTAALFSGEAATSSLFMAPAVTMAGFAHGYTVPVASALVPGAVLGLGTSLGFQALARGVAEEQRPGESVFQTVLRAKKLVASVALATGLGVYVGDRYASQLTVAGNVAISTQVGDKATSIKNIALDHADTMNEQLTLSNIEMQRVIQDMLEREDKERGGKAFFHAMKTYITQGNLQGTSVGNTSNTPQNLLGLESQMGELDTKHGTSITVAYTGYRTKLSQIQYPHNPALESLLRDPNRGFTEKLTAITKEVDKLNDASLIGTTALINKANAPMDLGLYSAINAANVTQFSSPDVAQAELGALGGDFNSLAQQIGQLQAVANFLSKATIDAINQVEEGAMVVLGKQNPNWNNNVLPPGMNIDIKIPNIDTILRVASEKLKVEGYSSVEEAQGVIQKKYGESGVENVRNFANQRALALVSLLVGGQMLLYWISLYRRNKGIAAIEQGARQCANKMESVIDGVHAWLNNQLRSVYPDHKGISRQYAGHLVWSLFIDIEPGLREFAPVVYLGEDRGQSTVKNTLWKYLTPNPLSDLKTTLLYKVLSSMDKGAVSEKAIETLLESAGMSGAQITEESIDSLIAASDAVDERYTQMSESSEDMAVDIGRAGQSIGALEQSEIEALDAEIYNQHITELKNLAQTLVSQPDAGIDIDSILSNIDKKYNEETTKKKKDIKQKYALDTVVPTVPGIRKSIVTALKSGFGNMAKLVKNIPMVFSDVSDKKTVSTIPKTPEAKKPVLYNEDFVQQVGSVEDLLKNQQELLKQLSIANNRNKLLAIASSEYNPEVTSSLNTSLDTIVRLDDTYAILAVFDKISGDIAQTVTAVDQATDLDDIKNLIRTLQTSILARELWITEHAEQILDVGESVSQVVNIMSDLNENEVVIQFDTTITLNSEQIVAMNELLETPQNLVYAIKNTLKIQKMPLFPGPDGIVYEITEIHENGEDISVMVNPFDKKEDKRQLPLDTLIWAIKEGMS